MLLSPLALMLIDFPTMSPSQGAPLCPGTDDRTPSSATRTVEFQQFGIRVKIPENFRAMLRSDGSVAILAPGDFNLLRCIAEGMPVSGTDAIEMQTFRLRPNPDKLDLKAFAMQDATPNLSDQFERQTINQIDLLIRQRRTERDDFPLTYGLFQVTGIDGVVEATTGTKAQLIDLFNQTQLLSEAEVVSPPPEEYPAEDNLILLALDAVKTLGYSTESDRETILRDNGGNETSTRSTVTITQEGLLDDSIAGQQFTLKFQINRLGQWDIISVEKRVKCQPNRGSQSYSTDPCL